MGLESARPARAHILGHITSRPPYIALRLRLSSEISSSPPFFQPRHQNPMPPRTHGGGSERSPLGPISEEVFDGEERSEGDSKRLQ